MLAAIVTAAAGFATTQLHVEDSSNLAGIKTKSSAVRKSPRTDAVITPINISTIAIGPNGNVYLADRSRDQILERLSNWRFRIVAGTGSLGFSGDGGRATSAELDDPMGMAFAKSGTLYFADTGNGRVREILPDGIIEMVAGDGAPRSGGQPASLSSPFPHPVAAIESPLAGVSDVTLGPGGDLYIADGQVLKLANAKLAGVAPRPTDPFKLLRMSRTRCCRWWADG